MVGREGGSPDDGDINAVASLSSNMGECILKEQIQLDIFLPETFNGRSVAFMSIGAILWVEARLRLRAMILGIRIG